MPVPSALSPTSGLSLARGLLLAVLPQGGQQTARRNAWAATVADAQLARCHREANAAISVAQARAAGAAAASG